MEKKNLLEKLSKQVQSFQESFEILSNSYNLKEMTKNFSNILKEVFSIETTTVCYKLSGQSAWEELNNNDGNFLSSLNYDNFKITTHTDNRFAVSVIVLLQDSTTIAILLGNKSGGEAYTELDKITLQILLQVFGSAYNAFLNRKKKGLIFDLNEKVFQLNNLIDTGIELSRYGQKNILFNHALERVSSLTNASSALIKKTYKNKNKKEEHLAFPSGINAEDVLNSKFKIESSFEFQNNKYHFFLSQKETRGGTTAFNELDELLLEAVSRQVAASIENDFLHQQSLEKELIEKELEVAASIQQQIIPKELPEIKGYEISGINIPSKEVGGDYYDSIKLKNGNIAIIIADVSGKGISAALLVNTLNAALYAYLEFNLPLTEMCDKLNTLIFKSSPADKYITFFISVLNPETGELDSVNAGHNPIFLLRKNGKLEKLDDGGPGLGMLDFGIPYDGKKVTIEPGDKLFLYTDGIPEAMNENEEEYSDEKMIDFFKNNSDKNANDFIRYLVGDVKAYVGKTAQSDDITALLIKRN